MQFKHIMSLRGLRTIHRMALGHREFNNAEFEFLTAAWMELRVSECYTVSNGEYLPIFR